MYHTAVYSVAAAGVNAVNTDFLAATDPILTQRNNHYILDVPWQLGRIMPVGASLTRGRLQIQSWLGFTLQPDLFNVNRAATVPSNPQYDDWLDYPLKLPLNEELQIQYSNNLGASTEQETAILQLLGPEGRTPPQPGPFRGVIEATAVITPTVNAWGGLTTVTLVSNLRNGVWEVYDTIVQGTNSAAYRLVFPTQRSVQGKFVRPGGPVQNAIGDVPNQQRTGTPGVMGVLGRFHTVALPQIEVFGLTASSTTYRIFLWATYLGEDFSLLSSWAGAGSMQSTI